MRVFNLLISLIFSYQIYNKFSPYFILANSISSLPYHINTDSSAFIYLQDIIKQDNPLSEIVLEITLKNKWWNSTKLLINDYFNKNHIDVFPIFQKYKKSFYNDKMNWPQFEQIIFMLPLDSDSVKEISPAFLWGQNMTFLFVKIKFSPKIDTPGVLEVQNINITFKYDRFIFSALNLDGKFTLHYYLEIETYQHINPLFCKWSLDSVGSVYLELMKSPAPYFWRNIHFDQFKKLPNQYMWWDVYYNYMEDFNKYGANALLLFDQREHERDIKEEKEEIRNKLLKKDEKLSKEINMRFAKEKKIEKINRQVCLGLLHLCDQNSIA